MEPLRLIKNAGFNITNTVAGLLAGVGTSIILARYLTPIAYGEYQTALWIVSICSQVLGQAIAEPVRRFTAEMDGAQQERAAFKLVSVMFWIQSVVALIAALILIAIPGRIVALLRQPILTTHIVLAAIALVPEMLGAYLRYAIEGRQRYGGLMLIGIIRSLLSFAAAGVVVVFDYHISGLLIATIAISGLSAIAYGYILRRLHYRLVYFNTQQAVPWKPFFAYSASKFATLLMDMVVWQPTAIFFLNRLSMQDEVGFYSLASSLAYVAVSTIPLAIGGVLVPALTERWGAADLDSMKTICVHSLRIITLIGLPICAGGIALADRLVLTLYGIDFARVADVMPFLLLSTIALVMTSPAASALLAAGKPAILAQIAALSAVINIILAIVLTSPYGAVGAAGANMIVRIISALLTWFALGRVLRLSFPLKSILAMTLSAALCGAIASVVVTAIKPAAAALIVSAICGAAVYFTAVILLRAFSKQEMDRLLHFIRRRWSHES